MRKNKSRENTPVSRVVRPVVRRVDRQRSVNIKNAIISSLERFPKNVHELAVELKTNRRTIENHMEYLEDLGVISQARFKLRRGYKQLWMLAGEEPEEQTIPISNYVRVIDKVVHESIKLSNSLKEEGLVNCSSEFIFSSLLSLVRTQLEADELKS